MSVQRRFVRYAAIGGIALGALELLRREWVRRQKEKEDAIDYKETKMQALGTATHSSPLTIQEVDIPECKDRDLLVRVMATGVNPVDWKKLNSKP
eukprot:CAMPEP_0169465320 /NCGR_PEP_ID=MMETSP1042-20121227/21147_1 /TAXON_ID=464988 /ORGANISM="Hemiselmis andersenii, Strain CCMP1180" /LENGTH=94 /DNA_ID=CAMNT_0009578249 /DNA_START=118 /DNA_END=399 /DNA_ORIENTATION=+